MAHFRVSWHIDIEAGTPKQAAQQALDIQRDPKSTATVFDVQLMGPCPTCKQHQVHKHKGTFPRAGAWGLSVVLPVVVDLSSKKGDLKL